jgi:NAD(P)-dependent dehydrogenase (short-subunit alcohol dehydrogenase family)
MDRTLIVGGTGRLGTAVGERLRARGDEVFRVGREFTVLPEALNYVVFCQRYRGPQSLSGEFVVSVALTARVLDEIGFAEVGDCAVVIVSSVYGVEPGEADVFYQVAKAAEIHLAKIHAKRLAARVNCVSPWGFTGDKPPLEMREVVDVIEFLCSPKSSGLNGQNIVVDKGRHA